MWPTPSNPSGAMWRGGPLLSGEVTSSLDAAAAQGQPRPVPAWSEPAVPLTGSDGDALVPSPRRHPWPQLRPAISPHSAPAPLPPRAGQGSGGWPARGEDRFCENEPNPLLVGAILVPPKANRRPQKANRRPRKATWIPPGTRRNRRRYHRIAPTTIHVPPPFPVPLARGRATRVPGMTRRQATRGGRGRGPLSTHRSAEQRARSSRSAPSPRSRTTSAIGRSCRTSPTAWQA